jgi:hypothetical protein
MEDRMNTPIMDNSHEARNSGIAAFMDPSLYHSLSGLIQQLYPRPMVPAVRSLVLTAPHSSSGVSYLSSCTATLLAEEFGSTILVDGQTIEAFAKAGKAPTRVDCSSVRNSQLWVLGSSDLPRSVRSEHNAPWSLSSVVEALLKEFKFVIIDAPAISESTIAESLAPHVDGSILVVVPNVTEVRQITIAKMKLTTRGGRLFGAIYNSSQDGLNAEGQA